MRNNPAQLKLTRFSSALISAFFLLFFQSKEVFASVLINEIYPNPVDSNENEWVEFYNPENIDIKDWILEEKTSTGNITQHRIGDNFTDNEVFDVFTFSVSKLNNDGDSVKILEGSSVKDEYVFVETVKASSFSRVPDGGAWQICDHPTKGESNNEFCSSVLASLELSASPTPLVNPEKGEYKINEVKDEDGNVLSSVKVFVNGVYVHHYAPETLIFCNNCKCDDLVNCGFGEFTIHLEKSGYDKWEDKKTINSGDKFEVNVVLGKTVEADNNPGESPISLPTNASPLSSAVEGNVLGNEDEEEQKLAREATFTGEILNASSSSEIENIDEDKKDEEENQDKKLSLSLAISSLGLGFLSLSSLPFLKRLVLKKLVKK
ncbi:hypothetical protein ACFLZ1_04885 [Patescibacteria group bacterium]